jgi:hypothetical protein
MARKTSISPVEAYIDVALAAAERERRSPAAALESASLTIVDSLRAAFVRPSSICCGTALLVDDILV